ncbi:MAG: hypothetical protein BWY71_00510 [Planctomycetes bacterium ADurb.Bin412]|nr:MAG: hypothetical protein BWY71_00510 [Planctomycetes bacterium ADurb.Bin412]
MTRYAGGSLTNIPTNPIGIPDVFLLLRRKASFPPAAAPPACFPAEVVPSPPARLPSPPVFAPPYCWSAATSLVLLSQPVPDYPFLRLPVRRAIPIPKPPLHSADSSPSPPSQAKRQPDPLSAQFAALLKPAEPLPSNRQSVPVPFWRWPARLTAAAVPPL